MHPYFLPRNSKKKKPNDDVVTVDLEQEEDVGSPTASTLTLSSLQSRLARFEENESLLPLPDTPVDTNLECHAEQDPPSQAVPPQLDKNDEIQELGDYGVGGEEQSAATIDDPHAHFTLVSTNDQVSVPTVHTQIDFDELAEDKWVIVRYRGEYFLGQVMFVIPDTRKAKIKCLEKPSGVHVVQDFEKTKFWTTYLAKNIFKSPVVPSKVKVKGVYKWVY